MYIMRYMYFELPVWCGFTSTPVSGVGPGEKDKLNAALDNHEPTLSTSAGDSVEQCKELD